MLGRCLERAEVAELGVLAPACRSGAPRRRRARTPPGPTASLAPDARRRPGTSTSRQRVPRAAAPAPSRTWRPPTRAGSAGATVPSAWARSRPRRRRASASGCELVERRLRRRSWRGRPRRSRRSGRRRRAASAIGLRPSAATGAPGGGTIGSKSHRLANAPGPAGGGEHERGAAHRVADAVDRRRLGRRARCRARRRRRRRSPAQSKSSALGRARRRRGRGSRWPGSGSGRRGGRPSAPTPGRGTRWRGTSSEHRRVGSSGPPRSCTATCTPSLEWT